jgi:glycosyltransferase involved in cell wall biosynthesis
MIEMEEGRIGMKILMVTSHYFPCIGGTETHVYEVGRRLVRCGVGVTVLTTFPHRPYPEQAEEEVVDGMRIVRVPSWPDRTDYYIAPRMIKVIQESDWDLMHCQGCHTVVPLLAMYAASKSGKPYIVTFHSGGHSSHLRNSLRSIQWRVLRPFFANAARLIGVSRFEVDYFRSLLRLPDEQFSLIANGIAVSAVEPIPLSGSPLIVSPGRLERYKGQHRLIAALPHILRRYPQARLLLLGQGSYEQTLRAMARQKGVQHAVEICMIRAEKREQMAYVLSRATIVVLLSEYEAHPVAILEAMALGKSVLVAHTSGLKDLVEQGFVRSIPLESTSVQIAWAISRQIQHPHVPSNGHRLPCWDDTTQQLLTVYQQAMGGKICVS